MATGGMDSGLGIEIELTCKHEFESWTCVVVMKIQPPLKVERHNDLHWPSTNPTSPKVNIIGDKTLANTEPQTPPLRTVKKDFQNLNL